MSLGSDIAAEVNAALRDASVSVGDGELIATLSHVDTDGFGPPNRPTPALTQDYPVAVVVSSFSALERQASSIQAGDVKVLCQALAVEPSTRDSITINGVRYQITNVTTLRPGGVALMHMLQCRR